MIVIRHIAQCRPEKTEQMKGVFQKVVAASRDVEGLISIQIGQDLVDPNVFFSFEVFEDQAAIERQEASPVIESATSHLPEALAVPLETATFHVTSAETVTSSPE